MLAKTLLSFPRGVFFSWIFNFYLFSFICLFTFLKVYQNLCWDHNLWNYVEWRHRKASHIFDELWRPFENPMFVPPPLFSSSIPSSINSLTTAGDQRKLKLFIVCFVGVFVINWMIMYDNDLKLWLLLLLLLLSFDWKCIFLLFWEISKWECEIF